MADNLDTQTDRNLAIGSRDYRAFVGPPEKYDIVAAMQFNLLTHLGLREDHFLLDIGCGSLRAGRLFIPYLLAGHYYGMEPEKWCLEEGIERELGAQIVEIKKPVFSHDADFSLTFFGRQFDFLIAQSIFSHAAPGQVERCLSQARQVMTATSLFAATFVCGEESYSGSSWVYPGCITYTLPFLSELARRYGLACVPLEWSHPNNQTWVVFTDPANVESLPALYEPARAARKIAKLQKNLLVKIVLKWRALRGKRL